MGSMSPILGQKETILQMTFSSVTSSAYGARKKPKEGFLFSTVDNFSSSPTQTQI